MDVSTRVEFNVQAMYGRKAEDVLAGWVRLDSFCLDRADQARVLNPAVRLMISGILLTTR